MSRVPMSQQDSPYRNSFFKFHNEHDWPYNSSYDGWWGHDTLPKLNYESFARAGKNTYCALRQNGSPRRYNVDGWRLDVAADLGHSQEYNHAVLEGIPEGSQRSESGCD